MLIRGIAFDEAIVPAEDFKPRLTKFTLNLLRGYFMMRRCSSRRPLAVRTRFTVDDNQTPTRNQRPDHMKENRLGIRKFMVCVGDEYGIGALDR